MAFKITSYGGYFMKFQFNLSSAFSICMNFVVSENLYNFDHHFYFTGIRETVTYTCVAASRWGVIESKTTVRVQTLPRPPENLKATEITPTSVKLSWSYPGTGSEVQYYVIEYRPKRATWDWKEISGAITQFYDIRGLTPYTEYEFVVLGVNNVGRGEKSAPTIVTTGDSDGTDQNPASEFFYFPTF